MVKGIIISRKSDGLIFCEVMENDDNDKQFSFIRSRAQEFLKNMTGKENIIFFIIKLMKMLFI